MTARNPVWIGCLRAGTSEALINRAFAGRVPGDALNTRASGQVMKLKIRIATACALTSTYETSLDAVALSGSAPR